MNSADLTMNMNSSNVTDMVIKEEPGSMADSFFMNDNNDGHSMPMISVKDEPVVMNERINQLSLIDTDETCEEEDNGLDNPFSFETDHVALKNNRDYQLLLRTIILLESQRQTALKDLDTLIAMRKVAMNEPIQFVEKLQSRVDFGIPRAQKVVSLPIIPWDRYKADVEATQSLAATGRGGSAPQTRNKFKMLLTMKEDPEPVTDSMTTSQMEDALENGIRIRSSTFNQRWSPEEQKHFEQLILKYPPERNQTKRHEKIARELGTRTTVQVASHFQKWSKKLTQWKLPIPGDMPNGVFRRKRGGIGGRGRHRQSYYDLYGQTSTFLASYEVPVYMSENESEDNAYPGTSYMGHNGDYTSETRSESSDDEGLGDHDEDFIPQHLKNSAEYLELKQLKNIKRDFKEVSSTVRYTKSDLKCVVCGEKLAGESWKCVECPPGQDVQFCSVCSKREFNTGFHVSSHLLEIVDVSLAGLEALDQDYSYSGAETYSYLDPNYRCKKPD